MHTDARVRSALREVSADATVIVAQRISTVTQADQVVVVDGGRVVGAGTHDRLLVECPVYAEFVDRSPSAPGSGATVTGPGCAAVACAP